MYHKLSFGLKYDYILKKNFENSDHQGIITQKYVNKL